MPNGSMGFRSPTRRGPWNLDLDGVDPALSLRRRSRGIGEVCCPSHRARRYRQCAARGVPVQPIGEPLVTTVFDLMLAQYGVGATGLPGEWPTGYGDGQPVHPGLAGGDHHGLAQVASGRARVRL